MALYLHVRNSNRRQPIRRVFRDRNNPLEVLRNFVHYRLVEKKTISESTKLTVINVISFWEKAQVPTKQIDSCQTAVRKLYDDY